jgi:hypothetical protein
MMVRQRMQYFPAGGGAMGPVIAAIDPGGSA